MNAFLWTLQVLLAVLFSFAGITKINVPKDQLATKFTWLGSLSPTLVHFIGGLEVLGAIGLILPAITKIATVLTPLAASGLALIMLGAFGVHLRRHEVSRLPVTVILLALTVVVAWGRFGPYPL